MKLQEKTELVNFMMLFNMGLEEYGEDQMERFVDDLLMPWCDILRVIEDCNFVCDNADHQAQVRMPAIMAA